MLLQLIYQSVLDGSVDLTQDGGVSKKAVVTAQNTEPKAASGGCCS